MKNLTAIILLLATTLANASEQSPARLYHWPYLKFTPYTNALGKKLPNGDISAKRAFYWGRVIGCDGVAFNVRGLTPALEEGNWFEPVYRSVKEKATIFGLMKQFQQMYARYGCSDNFLHLHAHPLLKRHPTHIPKDVKQWRKWVIDERKIRTTLISCFLRFFKDLLATISNQNRLCEASPHLFILKTELFIFSFQKKTLSSFKEFLPYVILLKLNFPTQIARMPVSSKRKPLKFMQTANT